MKFKIISVCKGGGYRYARTSPIHPKANSKGLYPLHRVKMENKLGRLLKRGEVVHHKDENKQNDRTSNLVLTTRSKHSKHHAKKVELVKCFCANCQVEFYLKPHLYRLREKRTTQGICCSRSCSTELNFKNTKA